MEISARYVAVGLFTVLVVMAGFGYVFWKTKAGFDRATALYDIYFDAPVSGLTMAGEVQFNGIKVGQIKEIAVVPDRPDKVRVRVEIDEKTPVRQDSVAKLEPKGITGVTFVQILGGSVDSPSLAATSERPVPVIPSVRSEMAELFSSAPRLLERAIEVMENLNEVLGPDNRQALRETLANVRDLSATLASQRGAIADTIDDASVAARNFAAASGRLDEIFSRAESTFEKADSAMASARETFERAGVFIDQDLAQAARSFRELAENINSAVDEASPGLAAFSNEGLANLNRLLRDASQLAASLERLAWRIESDPQSLFFGVRVPEEELR